MVSVVSLPTTYMTLQELKQAYIKASDKSYDLLKLRKDTIETNKSLYNMSVLDSVNDPFIRTLDAELDSARVAENNAWYAFDECAKKEGVTIILHQLK